MGEFLQFVKKLTPSTGRLMTENGETVNEADLLARQDRVTFLLAAEDQQVFNAFYYGTIGANATLNFSQIVSVGGLLRGVNFNIVTNGNLDYEQWVGATSGNALETLPTHNAFRSNTDPCPAPVRRIDGFTGGRQVDAGFILVPSGAGQSRANC